MKDIWELQEILAVSVNVSVEVKTFSMLGWDTLGPLGHLINLMVRSVLGMKKSRPIVAKGRSMVIYFHQSPLATFHFKKKQKLLLGGKAYDIHCLIMSPQGGTALVR